MTIQIPDEHDALVEVVYDLQKIAEALDEGCEAGELFEHLTTITEIVDELASMIERIRAQYGPALAAALAAA